MSRGGVAVTLTAVRVIRSTAAMQRLALRCKREGRRIAFMPSMGFLHAGHLSLVHRARRAAGPRGLVVVSIYVNPTQFGPHEDLAKYPRDLRRDLKLCREAGADVIFAPSDAEMYPGKTDGGYSTYVVEERLSQAMEGASRPGHFRGVVTIVAKLFNLVQPDVAVFGAKDWQQAAIVRRMTRDLNFSVRILVAPTVRERDGLALSSRNQYLSAEERPQATVLFRALQHARQRVRRGAVVAARLKTEIAELIATQPAARLDYVEFFDSNTLTPVVKVQRGTHVALAVFLGKTRLIDNGRL